MVAFGTSVPELAVSVDAVFAGCYVAYTIYLALDATDHGALPEFRDAMLSFVLPLTALTLALVATGPVRATRRGDG
ncbi:MAG: hypothetical protein ACODAB_02800 [Gemmatimonadota bacterium]